MTLDVTWSAAFLAGLLSFLSPCVLPLVPPYLAYLAGTALEAQGGEGEGPARAGRLMPVALAFVLGFATVFIALGATASLIGQMLATHIRTLSVVAGIVVAVVGLHFLGLLRIPLLYREARFSVAGRPASLIGAYLVGLAFGFGWSPCVGPILTTVLMLAADQETAWRGGLMLAVYAAGLGVPFLVVAAFTGPSLALMRRFRRHLGLVEKATGAFLVATGLVLATGTMPAVAQWLLDTFPALGRIG
ncbi:cytochrome c biogenesis CcdA family protein [Prosthecomicrobium hirschii]|uniref:cytochrome c biogenesis CcdA family protein n=1 Tax=Prosthecodimorpha hirschii TaxID=665126 RepID=UPI00221F0571|nr:cytochrome c biogenesis CcdA family protein [Prosthecomicrobium hirschii]MCW1842817.1 cytochrome c biogenesis CcdA family protein [Prosthecomicrobium hirschii]